MQDNSRGEPEIVLGIAEEARLQHVALHAQADSVNQPIVDASTERAGKRSVRVGKPGRAFVYVRSSEQGVCKGREFPHPDGHARAEHHGIQVRIGAEAGGSGISCEP